MTVSSNSPAFQFHEATNLRALIFDLDGTLIDTVYAHVFSWQRAFWEAGLPVDGWRIHRRMGMSGGLFTARRGTRAGSRSQRRGSGKFAAPPWRDLRAAHARPPAAFRRGGTAAVLAHFRRPVRHRHFGESTGDRRLAGRVGDRQRHRCGRTRPRPACKAGAGSLSGVPAADGGAA